MKLYDVDQAKKDLAELANRLKQRAGLEIDSEVERAVAHLKLQEQVAEGAPEFVSLLERSSLTIVEDVANDLGEPVPGGQPYNVQNMSFTIAGHRGPRNYYPRLTKQEIPPVPHRVLIFFLPVK